MDLSFIRPWFTMIYRVLKPLGLYILILIIVLSFIIIYNRDATELVQQKASKHCLEGVVIIQNGDRLGNQIMNYATVWSIAKVHNLKPVISVTTLRALSAVFDDLTIRPTEMYLYAYRNNEGGTCSMSITEETLLHSPTANQRTLSIQQLIQRTQQNDDPLVLKPDTMYAEGVAKMAKELKNEFRLKPKFIASAQRTLGDIHDQMSKSYALGEQIVFVGIHVRRTDYNFHLLLKHNVHQPAKMDYFRHAVAWMRNQLYKDHKSAVNIAFVLSSDDVTWCREKLLPEIYKERQAKNSTLLGNFEVFIGGRGDAASSVTDFALLCNCNHSIIAYGTYGIMAALLAGGRTAVYNPHGSNKNNFMIRELTSVQLSQFIPGWAAIN